MAILLALSVVVLAGKKDEYQRGGGCPCADFKSYEARDDESYSRGKRAPSGDDFSSRMRERKAFVKRQEKFRPRFSEGEIFCILFFITCLLESFYTIIVAL